MSAHEGRETDAQRRRALRVGSELPALARATSTVQIFRYSAATWNTHRIHYDKDYALAEGYPGVLVQSHLHGAFLAQYCTDWAGDAGRLLELGLRVTRFAVAGETLTIVGTVSAVERITETRAAISLDLTETRGSDGETCATGSARIAIPSSWLANSVAAGPADARAGKTAG
jgi:acyl dehydratase